MGAVVQTLGGGMEHIVEEGVVSITYEELVKLREDSAKLNALRNHGVDNWDGWDDAMQEYHEWMEWEEE